MTLISNYNTIVNLNNRKLNDILLSISYISTLEDMLFELTSLLSFCLFTAVDWVLECDYLHQIDRILAPRVSRGASIVHSTAAVLQWSEYYAPQLGTVVNVVTEEDVVVTLCYPNLWLSSPWLTNS